MTYKTKKSEKTYKKNKKRQKLHIFLHYFVVLKIILALLYTEKQNDMHNENFSQDQEQTVFSCMSRGYTEKKNACNTRSDRCYRYYM